MPNPIVWFNQSLTYRDVRLVEPAIPLRGVGSGWAGFSRFDSEAQRERTRYLQLQMELKESQAQLVQLRSQLEFTLKCERVARYLANHDGLTALPNRRAFLDKLSAALGSRAVQAGRLAVMFIDLDRFKFINDTFGHSVGDQLLAVVGARLTHAVRGDDVAARLGGDEFACLLMHAPSSKQIVRVVKKLYESIAAPVQLGTLCLQVHPSIGIATSGKDLKRNAEQLMSLADRAMYRAKRLKCRFSFAHRPDEERIENS